MNSKAMEIADKIVKSGVTSDEWTESIVEAVTPILDEIERLETQCVAEDTQLICGNCDNPVENLGPHIWCNQCLDERERKQKAQDKCQITAQREVIRNLAITLKSFHRTWNIIWPDTNVEEQAGRVLSDPIVQACLKDEAEE